MSVSVIAYFAAVFCYILCYFLATVYSAADNKKSCSAAHRLEAFENSSGDGSVRTVVIRQGNHRLFRINGRIVLSYGLFCSYFFVTVHSENGIKQKQQSEYHQNNSAKNRCRPFEFYYHGAHIRSVFFLNTYILPHAVIQTDKQYKFIYYVNNKNTKKML